MGTLNSTLNRVVARLAIAFAFALVVMPASHAADSDECAALLTEAIPTKWVDKMIAEGKADDPQVQRLRDIVQRAGFNTVALNRAVLRNHNDQYTLELAQGPITDQKQSGRCWIFAGLNMVRSALIAEGRVPKDFEFSENYLHFFNMLEKSNRYLESAIKAVYKNRKDIKRGEIEDIRDSLEPHISDGGWFEYFELLVAKYGMVPKSAMPETKSSENTATLQKELNFYLSRAAAEMVDGVRQAKRLNKKDFHIALRGVKERALRGVWKILSTHLGDPPQRFTMRHAKNTKAPKGIARTQSVDAKTYSPREFATEFVKFNPRDYVVVSAYPRRAQNVVFEKKNTSIGPAEPGQEHAYDIRFMNLSPERMEELAVAALDGGQAIWFGADIGQSVDHATGIMHPDVFDRESIYKLEKDERLGDLSQPQLAYFSQIAPTHAMLLTGYDRPDPNGPVVKFKNENSWGDDIGQKGVYHLYTEWFHKYVFEIIVHKRFLSEAEGKLWEAPATTIKPGEDMF